MSGRHALHNKQPSTKRNDTDGFVAALLRDLDLRDRDQSGQVRWEAALQRRNPAELLEEIDYRNGLWNRIPAAQRQFLPNGQLGDGLSRLVESLHHTIPIDGAEAAWVYDPRLGAHASPKLMVNVYLHDPENAQLLRSRVMFTSDVPPGTDVSTLSPADFDPNVYLHETWGYNEEASLYRMTPRPNQVAPV